jgi:hypothetical protein
MLEHPASKAAPEAATTIFNTAALMIMNLFSHMERREPIIL